MGNIKQMGLRSFRPWPYRLMGERKAGHDTRQIGLSASVDSKQKATGSLGIDECRAEVSLLWQLAACLAHPLFRVWSSTGLHPRMSYVWTCSLPHPCHSILCLHFNKSGEPLLELFPTPNGPWGGTTKQRLCAYMAVSSACTTRDQPAEPYSSSRKALSIRFCGGTCSRRATLKTKLY